MDEPLQSVFLGTNTKRDKPHCSAFPENKTLKMHTHLQSVFLGTNPKRDNPCSVFPDRKSLKVHTHLQSVFLGTNPERDNAPCFAFPLSLTHKGEYTAAISLPWCEP